LLLNIDGVADAEDVRQLTGWAQEGKAKGWWADYTDLLQPPSCQYLGLEAAAATLRSYCPVLMPDLLQTKDYAAAAVRAIRPGIRPESAGRLAAATMRRQDIMRDGGTLHAIIDEAALRTAVGSAQVMAEQVRHLALSADQPGVTVQVLAMATPRPVICPPFTVLSFRADPDLAFTGIVGGQVTLSKPAGTAAACDAFARIAKAALSAAESARLLASIPDPVQE